MLYVVWVVRDASHDTILESRNSACHNRVKEERNGTLCDCLVTVEV